MNRIILTTTLALASAPIVLRGAESSEALNRFSLGATIGLNFKASFRKAPTSAGVNNPGPATGGVNHAYDDGYVGVDSSGNAGGRTWNWGYTGPAIEQVVNDTMVFRSRDANPAFANYNKKATDDPQYGLELMYQRVIQSFGSAGRWGLEAAFNFTDLDIESASAGPGRNSLTTDTYLLSGVIPPGAGYNGTFNGPGALLGATPTRTVTFDTMTSLDTLSGQLFNYRLGPFVEWNFTPKLRLSASIGLALTPAAIEYDYTETTQLAGGGSTVSSGHSSRGELLYGYYAGALLHYDLSDHWSLYVGGKFQRLNSLNPSVAGRSARLDQSATVNGSIGVSYRF